MPNRMNPYNDFDPAALTQIRDHAKLIHEAHTRGRDINDLGDDDQLVDHMNTLRYICDMILENQD